VATGHCFLRTAKCGSDERGRHGCDSDSCPRISSGRSIEKIHWQMGNVDADSRPWLVHAAARWIMRNQRVCERINWGKERCLVMAQDIRARKTGQEQRRQAGRRTEGARRPLFLLPFGSALSSSTHCNYHPSHRSIGLRRKRLDVFGIKIFPAHGRRRGRERWQRQAPA
jgi:hypothetical protein